jgi:signal transduction histidine kinase
MKIKTVVWGILVLVYFLVRPQTIFPQSTKELGYQELSDTWKYSWGESPFNQEGVIDDSLSANWKSVEYRRGVLNPPDREGASELWLRYQLPARTWSNPNLLILDMSLPAEIYLDGKLLYSLQNLGEEEDSLLSIPRMHIIPVDPDYPNKVLFVRLSPEDPNFIGIGQIFIGSQLTLIRKLITDNIQLVILGFIFLTTGLIPLLLFIKKRREKIYFAYGFFSLIMGFVTIGEARPLLQLIFGFTYIRSGFFIIATFLMPVGLAIYFEAIFGSGYRSIIRRMWQIHLIFAIISFFVIMLNIFPFSYLVKMILIFFTIFFITITVLLATSVAAAIKGSTEARIILAGFTVFALFGLYDIIGGVFHFFPFWSGVIYPWGMFVLILSLGFVLERRFSKAHEKLQEYSKGLEVKVAERTRALNEKNESLEKTLAELKSTQIQLVQSEKMASLGQLTAGVAHEINNPIGAIKSNIAVNESCLKKIKNWFSSVSANKEMKDIDQLNKLIGILEKSNVTNKMASDRIIEIVNSLKNFARLDEAEYQKADIHKGIDSALTLLAPKLREKIDVIKEYGNIPQINCYPNQLNQAFMNILSNAILAIEGEGTITIRTEVTDANIKIRIKDTGVGIPEEHKDKLFDPFFTTRKIGEGRGLGLSITLGIIEKHNGSIEVISAINEGSEFIISLPVQ